MSQMPLDCVPRLARGCRLNSAGGEEDLVLIPEGALRLKGPARAILDLCDGERALRQIIGELRSRYPSDDPARIEAEVMALLTRLCDRGILEYA